MRNCSFIFRDESEAEISFCRCAIVLPDWSSIDEDLTSRQCDGQRLRIAVDGQVILDSCTSFGNDGYGFLLEAITGSGRLQDLDDGGFNE